MTKKQQLWKSNIEIQFHKCGMFLQRYDSLRHADNRATINTKEMSGKKKKNICILWYKKNLREKVLTYN